MPPLKRKPSITLLKTQGPSAEPHNYTQLTKPQKLRGEDIGHLSWAEEVEGGKTKSPSAEPQNHSQLNFRITLKGREKVEGYGHSAEPQNHISKTSYLELHAAQVLMGEGEGRYRVPQLNAKITLKKKTVSF